MTPRKIHALRLFLSMCSALALTSACARSSVIGDPDDDDGGGTGGGGSEVVDAGPGVQPPGDPDDADSDGVPDASDNCPGAANAGQEDTDGDGVGSACDNCPTVPNPDQANADGAGDNQGDVCDSDIDNDAVADDVDNCPSAANGTQQDSDEDGIGDACEAGSYVDVCGDGYRTGAEECDDGLSTLPDGGVGPRGGDGCDENCDLEPGYTCGADGVGLCTSTCGDGIRASNEICDPGTDFGNPGCTAQCTARRGYVCPTEGPCFTACGDGLQAGNEECDDGNFDPTDGCSDCREQLGLQCVGAVCSAVCGDGYTREGEACDDGDALSGDGCSSSCTVEVGYACQGTDPSRCDGVAGDGLVVGTEECDDGKHCSDGTACATTSQCGGGTDGTCAPRSGDGCDTDSRVEPGFRCNAPGQACIQANNNGATEPELGEECDDGNTVSGDGCTDGKKDPGYICDNTAASVCTADEDKGYECKGPGTTGAECQAGPKYGDGIVAPPEECDDGNTASNDGCSSTGRLEPGYACLAAGSPCAPVVGDGRIVGPEQCDDGNTVSGDGCSSTAVLEPGWLCDEEEPTVCIEDLADDLIVGTEECADGNAVNNDGCTQGVLDDGYACPEPGSPCIIANNDGLVTPPEQCDDGNEVDNDGCTDGVVTPGYLCTGEPSSCGADVAGGYECKGAEQVGVACQPGPIYGDGISVGDEACDTGDAQDVACVNGVVTLGYVCNDAQPSVCQPVYGDGRVVGTEACDDGNLNNNDGCSSTGAIEPGYACLAAGLPCKPIIGDGLVVGNEACDDANLTNNDGCSSIGTVEFGYTCETTPDGSVCTPVHGDGYIVGNEACDDGNITAADGCYEGEITLGYQCLTQFVLVFSGNDQEAGLTEYASSFCGPVFGDGRVVIGEACDDGNLTNNDGCSSTGTLEDGFDCEAGEGGQLPVTTCTVIFNDGLIRGTEQCDDGNTIAADGCHDGAFTPGWTCTGEPSQCSVVNNDGTITGNEQCDDGNQVAGDGCHNGVVEVGFVCSGQPSVCTANVAGGYECKGQGTVGAACQPGPKCGDGLIVAVEQCDDGNLANNDGCANTCVFEVGFTCQNSATNVPATSCSVNYGDGIVAGPEQCDDGNLVNNDGCSSTGQEELGFDCTNVAANTPDSTCLPIFNDGLIRGNEQCDDGNAVIAATDGCHNGVIDNHFTCVGQPSVCTAICGDGFMVVGKETCDDGNTNNNDGCSSTCAEELGWACNETNNKSACAAICGDGLKLGAEVCDDANQNNNDGCQANCLAETDGYNCTGAGANSCFAVCGDGYVVAGKETCDDGNTNNNDGCSAACAVENGYTCAGGANVNGTNPSVCTAVCGDGLKRAAEQCDDANVANGDGCTSTCTVENGYTCTGEGTGSCVIQLKAFLSTNTYLAGGNKRYNDITNDCKASLANNAAFFCSKAQLEARAATKQVHPNVYGVTLWRQDLNSCNDLVYNSGHLFNAYWMVLNNNGTTTATTNNCVNRTFRAACCLP